MRFSLSMLLLLLCTAGFSQFSPDTTQGLVIKKERLWIGRAQTVIVYDQTLTVMNNGEKSHLVVITCGEETGFINPYELKSVVTAMKWMGGYNDSLGGNSQELKIVLDNHLEIGTFWSDATGKWGYYIDFNTSFSSHTKFISRDTFLELIPIFDKADSILNAK